MSIDVFLHGVRDNWPVVHEPLGGLRVEMEIESSLKAGDSQDGTSLIVASEPEPGWKLIKVKTEVVIEILDRFDLYEVGAGTRDELKERVRKEADCTWFFWFEF